MNKKQTIFLCVFSLLITAALIAGGILFIVKGGDYLPAGCVMAAMGPIIAGLFLSMMYFVRNAETIRKRAVERMRKRAENNRHKSPSARIAGAEDEDKTNKIGG